MSPAATRPAARRAQPPRATPRRAVARRPTRAPAPRPPRRVSGPVGGGSAAVLAPRLPGLAPSPALRAVRFVSALPDRPLVERLVRGQGWILLLGFLLIGIVAMQVSLLKLNAGIGRAVERSSALERRNGELRAAVSRLSASERVQRRAVELGMVMPEPGSVTYLETNGGADARRAAEALRAGRLAPGPASVVPLSAPSAGAPGPTPVPVPAPTPTPQPAPAHGLASPSVPATVGGTEEIAP